MVEGRECASHRGGPPVFRSLERRGATHGATTTGDAARSQAMFAQLIGAHVDRERLATLEHAVRSELMPALREEPGFCGAVSLTDRARAETLLLLFWETEDQACRPLAQGVAPFASAPSTVSELQATHTCVVTVWDVDARS